MKTKLLKKLRKQFELQTRNGKYKVFDNVICLGGIYNQTDWIDKLEALKIRREWILKKSINYIESKNKINS